MSVWTLNTEFSTSNPKHHVHAPGEEVVAERHETCFRG